MKQHTLHLLRRFVSPRSLLGGRRRLGLAVVAGLCASVSSAQQTFVVTNTNTSGVGSLQQAVLNAEADAVEDLITFDATLQGQTIRPAATLAITRSVVFDATAAPGLKISGGWNGAKAGASGVRLFRVDGAAAVTFRKLHLTGGYGGAADNDALPAAGTPLSNGGLFYVDGGNIVLEDCLLSHSMAFDGGFISLYSGSVVAQRTSFVGGRARDDSGVAHVSTGATFTATECTFYNNRAGFAGGTTTNGNWAGSLFRSAGVLAFSHCTFAYNVGPAGAIYQESGAQLRVSNCLFSANDNGVGYETINGFGTYANFAGGATSAGDGNYSDNDVVADINIRTTAGIALGPLDYDASGRATAALDCRSVVRGAVTSSGTDQLGNPRGGSSEPGAREIGACVDRDGDGVIDYTDDDDDADGIRDTTELRFVGMGSAEMTTHTTGSFVPTGTTYAAGGVNITYTLSGDAMGVDGVTGVLGADGLRIRPFLSNSSQESILNIAFSKPVYGLTFALSDFNQATGVGQEVAEILLEDGIQRLVLDPTQVSLGSSVSRTGNQYVCTTSGGNGLTDLSSAVSVGPLLVPVTAIRLRFTAGAAASSSIVSRTFYLTELRFHHNDSIDIDHDGLGVLVDIDSDGDGVLDNFEAQATVGFDASRTLIIPVDTDGDGVPDFLDDDSDDDGEPDSIEAHDTNNDGIVDDNDADQVMNTGRAIGVDSDGDGLDDGYDNALAAYGGFGNPGSNYPNNDADNFDLDFRDIDGNLAGIVWHDANENGIRDWAETAIVGATVNVVEEATNTILTTGVTDSRGHYLFARGAGGFGNPPAGLYRVEVPTPGGFGNPTSFLSGTNERTDSDLETGTNRSRALQIDGNSAQPYLGAGFKSAALPVEIHGQGTRTDPADCRTDVWWSVGVEFGTAYYLVQARTANGGWASLDTVRASQQSDYSTRVDGGGQYLRIVDVDADGSSGAGAVMFGTPCGKTRAAVLVYPNPVQQGGQLHVGALGEGETATLYDATGRTIGEFYGSRTPLTIEVNTLPTGVYVLRVGGESVRVVVR